MDTSHGNPEGLLAFMNALADPSRLRLLRQLERLELGLAELCDVVQMPQSTVSRHLKVLADQGFVRSRADGTNRLYRMPPAEDVTVKGTRKRVVGLFCYDRAPGTNFGEPYISELRRQMPASFNSACCGAGIHARMALEHELPADSDIYLLGC